MHTIVDDPKEGILIDGESIRPEHLTLVKRAMLLFARGIRIFSKENFQGPAHLWAEAEQNIQDQIRQRHYISKEHLLDNYSKSREDLIQLGIIVPKN